MSDRFEYGTRRLADGRFVGTVTHYVGPMESVGYYETQATFATAEAAKDTARTMAIDDATQSGGYTAATR